MEQGGEQEVLVGARENVLAWMSREFASKS